MDSARFFPHRRRQPAANVRLVCFPFAGGSAAIYRAWPTLLGSSFDVCAVELRGRGTRFNEPASDRLDIVLEEVVEAVKSLDGPIALFGHSLGARLAFETARALGSERVAYVFASASPAPDAAPARKFADLSDEALKKELAELGGTPAAVTADAELMALLLPMLRADFALGDALARAVALPLSCPITALAGRTDATVDVASMERWASFTTAAFRMVVVDGGHFFLDASSAFVAREITSDLRLIC